MRIFSYTVLHYGKDYLSYALKSAYPFMDRLNVLYTPHPSHGYRTDIPPIETREELFGAAMIAVPSKLEWYETDIWQEGHQRDYAVWKCEEKGAELILVLDYDEVWLPEVLENILRHIWRENKARNWLLNFSHLWRSFGWICRDDAWPVRVIDLRHSGGVAYIPRELGPAYHFGYAVSDRIMRYKMAIHGHRGEYALRVEAFPPRCAA